MKTVHRDAFWAAAERIAQKYGEPVAEVQRLLARRLAGFTMAILDTRGEVSSAEWLHWLGEAAREVDSDFDDEVRT